MIISKKHFLSKKTISTIAGIVLLSGTVVFGAAITNFTQTINSGTLAVDIVDGSYVTVGSPAVAMSATSVGFTCQTSTGTFGTVTEQIYVSNPDAADNGWTVSLAAANTSSTWSSALPATFDFNDPTTSGCTDGADGDSVGGQMTINPAGATLATGGCVGCTTTAITKGSSSAFSQGVTDSITVLTAAAGSDDIGDWTLQGVAVSQKIPAQQAAASDYNIDLTLSIVAS
jgi:hypothetical protein